MRKYRILLLTTIALAAPALAEDEQETDAPVEADAGEEQVAATNPDGSRNMSGMSILGNEEAPKALVIVPWKTSELGDELSLSENLDDRATPVDKEVFQRELAFYEIRKSD